MTSKKMQDFILANFKGQIEPAFTVSEDTEKGTLP
jgi:hypothetical protein